MLTDGDVEIVDKRYGKNYVRLLCVKRNGRRHEMKEIEVNTKITLNDDKDYILADNSKVVATDTQKNTVYILAKQHGVRTIEEFAKILCAHFLRQYSQVTESRIYIEEKPWKRIQKDGQEHAHAFVYTSDGTRFCEVQQSRYGQPKVRSGIRELKVIKTTQSAFANFHRDEYRSLPDADDRIFCTAVESDWTYDTTDGVDYDKTWEMVKDIVVDTFAGPPATGVFSPSVQKTMYDTCKLALSKVPQMGQIQIILPNLHAYEFDLKKFPAFGFTKNGEIFQPTDKPSGNIRATVSRKVKARL